MPLFKPQQTPFGTQGGSVADIAALNGPMGMAAEVAPFIPKSYKLLTAVTKQILRKAGLLGFDSMPEALGAIYHNPDWATRWDVPELSHPVLNAWKTQKAFVNPPEPSDWELLKDAIREELQGRQPPPTGPRPVK